ncbi:MAG: glycosyltransferase family 2 protein [Candidatus Marinimicrobia bacterium]|nr:glycosyltransferase family 2 protein [Candidatus Neomarinimicrobiota bacterium]
MKDFIIIIPAYNSSNTIEKLLTTIKSLYRGIDIVVIDDGSRDYTVKVLEKFKNVDVLRNKVNRGKGYSLKKGLLYAKKMGYRYAITIDSDLQHPPEKIGEFIKANNGGDYEFVSGWRDFSPKIMPFHRILSNTITSLLISLRTGKRIHDSQCGFRLYKLENFKIGYYKENGFQFESEYLIRTLLKPDINFREIKIPTIYSRGSKSSINNLLDTIKFTMLFFRSYLW